MDKLNECTTNTLLLSNDFFLCLIPMNYFMGFAPIEKATKVINGFNGVNEGLAVMVWIMSFQK